MIKEIITDKLLLGMPSDPVKDITQCQIIMNDMLDTAEHWRTTKTGCVGLAANQVGWLRRIILIWNGAEFMFMINPTWKVRDGKMGSSHEQCLSRPGVNAKIKRHKRIEVEWFTPDMFLINQKFSNFTARVIQHEVDHLDGIFINN